MFKKILVYSIVIFLFGSLIHFFYNFLPLFITSIVAPVNESIAEHMKMIFSSYMLFLLVIFAFYKKKPNNYVFSNTVSALLNIIIFLIIYLPIKSLVGEIMIVTLITYFISIVITSYFKILIEKKKTDKSLNTISIFIIVFMYLTFTIFTYYPPKIKFFYDENTKSYGIYNLNK